MTAYDVEYEKEAITNFGGQDSATVRYTNGAVLTISPGTGEIAWDVFTAGRIIGRVEKTHDPRVRFIARRVGQSAGPSGEYSGASILDAAEWLRDQDETQQLRREDRMDQIDFLVDQARDEEARAARERNFTGPHRPGQAP